MIAPVMPNYYRMDLAFVRGEGPYVFAENGKRYLDFGAGVAVNSLGHAHPHLVAALREQAGKLWHTSNMSRIPSQERLAERLVAATFADTVFFCNSGAEAMECAIKMARRYHHVKGAPERYRLITFEGAFHGRTLATIAATGSAKFLDGFGPKVDGFDQVPLNMEAVTNQTGPQTAGIVLELIQGEVGARPVPVEFVKKLREFCNARDLLLIFDEVQTGVGRTGRLFAYEETGVTPDIMAAAKGLGSGFPIGACLATEAAAQGMTAGTHGSTFGGNPLATTVGNAVLDVVLAPGFLDKVRLTAAHLQQGLAGLQAQYPDVIGGTRGRGLMIGLQLNVPAAEFIARARNNGLLLVGSSENVARIVPPLIIDESHVREAVEILGVTAESYKASAA